MAYTKEQLQLALKKYYEAGLANPDAYEWGVDNLNPDVDSKAVTDILVNYMENPQ